MKTKMAARNWFPLAAAACACCALNLPAQTTPSITTQPNNQTVLAGSNVTFSVAVAGSGPFVYQWQFNGTNLPNNIITTVAGNGRQGYAGDGGTATNATMCDPRGLAFDAAGNLYIADQQNNCVRKVNTNGIIATVVGNGTPGYSGDGGQATNATVAWPNGVVLDAAGNLYVEDCMNQRIRKVDTNGIITTFAGNGTMPYPPTDGVQATNSSLHFPSGLALDATGNLYIADENDGRIRKVDTTGIISTVAGGGDGGDGGAATNAYLNKPMGETLDAVGNLYIADQDNNRVRKVSTNGIITTAAGNGIISYYLNPGSFSGDGGAATNAGLNDPWAVAFDASSNLYIADCLNNRIRRVDGNGIITTLAGNGSATYAGDGGPATNSSWMARRIW
jgi:hypothetical protein